MHGSSSGFNLIKSWAQFLLLEFANIRVYPLVEHFLSFFLYVLQAFAIHVLGQY